MPDDRRISVVADECRIAADRTSLPEAAGAIVLGGPSADLALAGMDDEASMECAVLYVNLGGEPVYRVAEASAARHIPLLFAGGNQDQTIQRGFSDALICARPIDSDLPSIPETFVAICALMFGYKRGSAFRQFQAIACSVNRSDRRLA